MAIFAILPQPNSRYSDLAAEVLRLHPDSFTLGGKTGWLVSAQTSAQNLSQSLGINNDESPNPAIVFEVTSYFGRANPNTWTWLKEKIEAARNG